MTSQPGIDNFWNEYSADNWGDAIVSAMKLGGVDYLFFVSGSESAFFQEAIAKAEVTGTPAPKLVTMIHESVAMNAALGASMATGKPTATSAHVDAGTLHHGGAIHTAWRGGYPILMTAGTGPRAFPGSMPGARDSNIQWVQEPRDQGGIVRQFTKADHRLDHTDNPGLMVSRLLQVALSEPRGPVYLQIPRETAMLPLPGATHFPTALQLGIARKAWPSPDDARTIAGWLVQSKNPLVMTDRLGHEPEAVAQLLRLAEMLALPVNETSNADRVNFPTTHALSGTGPAAKDADAILVLECFCPWIPGAGSPAPDAKIAWVSIDPVLSRLKTLEFRADCWLPVSSANALRAIADAAEGLLDAGARARIARRREELAVRKRDIVGKQDQLALADGKRETPTGRYVAYQLGRILRPDSIVMNDGLSNGGFVHSYARRHQGGTYYRSGSSTGGWGSGAAFGVKLVCPDQDVVLASGDGYFSFGTPRAALWAARHHSAPYLSVVFVNGTYSTGTTALRAGFPEGYAVRTDNYAGGSFDPPPDFSKYAEAVGGFGAYVTRTEEVEPTLVEAIRRVRGGDPAVVAVRVPGPLG